jgi:signal peptidase I
LLFPTINHIIFGLAKPKNFDTIKSMKSFLSFFWEIFKIVAIALVIVIPIRYFLFQPFLVSGQSMEPSFYTGDYLIVDEISYRLSSPQRGEVIVFRYPNNPSQRFIKRIIGLPGETIEFKESQIIIRPRNGKPWVLDESDYLPASTKTFSKTPSFTLSDGEYFVLGDNRSESSDSRRWGPLPKENIIGRTFLCLWPITAFAKVEVPEY